jgi:hypothetical protein
MEAEVPMQWGGVCVNLRSNSSQCPSPAASYIPRRRELRAKKVLE